MSWFFWGEFWLATCVASNDISMQMTSSANDRWQAQLVHMSVCQ